MAPADGPRVAALARDHGAAAPRLLPAHTSEGEARSLVVTLLPNDRVGAFVEAVQRHVDAARFVLVPWGTLPLEPPLHDVQERVRDVSRLSTLELVLSSLQSIGSWGGLAAYGLFAGTIAAYGTMFDVSWLLVAAMLINPMGAPAIVAVIGAAVGDARLLGRGTLRFGAALLLQAAVAAAVGWTYGLRTSTATMEQVTSLSVLAALVAGAAGAAGALSQVRSERDSLVSGTAAGFMVAAALAPPAAVLGLSLPLARWDYALLMTLLLLLQLAAILAGGWAALWVAGVRPRVRGTDTASRTWSFTSFAVAVLVLAGLVAWQLALRPRGTKADLSRDALQLVHDALDDVPIARLVESEARFTRARLERVAGEALLVQVVVERSQTVAEGADDSAVENAVRQAVQRRIQAQMRGVVPFVDVGVLPPR